MGPPRSLTLVSDDQGNAGINSETVAVNWNTTAQGPSQVYLSYASVISNMQSNQSVAVAMIVNAANAELTESKVTATGGAQSSGVLSNGGAVRSCSTPLETVAGKKITTIEGLSPDGSHPLQKAWLAENVPQCGYCQAGQIMNAAALLQKTKHPTDTQIDDAMSGNLCRCGTYLRIRRAIHRASEEA